MILFLSDTPLTSVINLWHNYKVFYTLFCENLLGNGGELVKNLDQQVTQRAFLNFHKLIPLNTSKIVTVM